ncbi:GNAT family N-acetyltransferase [Tamlana sp. 2_MG-2023]|uniref:GNAT family N-acetyltransferase n=1 Tax=unclassified Tamlana TaxID=2614803 RepID=UPI0026E399BC|nr:MULTISPECIES: GNAT family N-acetyltransferase [unclassified Tamlana]MDO6760318.1 GNAT family N-acetyltransferase [Tamlana sp. 2_MG-2023]MDO6789984.1 GNAT family N-acetyltransferase [Tamlana sp. 1_MG-2023]
MNQTDFHIKQITAQESYLVRQPVLRPGLPITSCVFDGDDLSTTIHLGLYNNNNIIGVCSFFKNDHAELSRSKQYQLRGMAVLENFQGKGIGYQILSFGERLMKEKNIKTIWCNAREIALPFYRKCGYQSFGEAFNIPNIGPHYSMFKTL